MKLQLVNFEQAKALKDLGFPQEKKSFSKWYSPTGYPDLYDFMDSLECYAPTLELVAKWLRDEKDLWIRMYKQIQDNGKWCSSVNGISSNLWKSCGEYNSYEEALSEGIDKAIEILKGI